MIRVLVADSDSENIKNFSTYIKNSFPQIKHISITNDMSKDFLEIVKATRPSLIIVDIRFLGVGNLQKIRTIYDHYPEIKFILYGTYKDGDYMRKSLEYGVLDYMYRPIKSVDFHRCVSLAIDYFDKNEINKRKEDEIVKSYKGEIHLFENVFLSSVVQGYIKDEAEIENSFKYFHFDLKPPYTMILIRIDNFKKIILALDEMEKHLMTYKILLAIEKELSKKKSKTFIGSLNCIQVILSGEYTEEAIVELCESMKNTIYDETNIRTTLGIGRTYGKATDIPVSYREASAALRYRFVMGYNSVIHIQFVEPRNNISYRYPLEKEERFIHTAVVGEYQYCITLLREIFDALKENGPLPEFYISKIVMNILISINRYLSEQKIQMDSPFTAFFPTGEVLELNDIEGAYEFLCGALKKFCDWIVENREKLNQSLIEGTKKYLAEKYYETISVVKIATALGTTPEYLSKIFMKQEKVNIFDYAVQVRLNEAKRLLSETTFDDDMIAVKVGYDDPRYFRSIFKQQEGMNTYEYKAIHNKHEYMD